MHRSRWVATRLPKRSRRSMRSSRATRAATSRAPSSRSTAAKRPELSSGRLEPDRAGDAGAAEPAVAVRHLREVLLVVVLGVVERPRRGDLGRDLAVARP